MIPSNMLYGLVVSAWRLRSVAGCTLLGSMGVSKSGTRAWRGGGRMCDLCIANRIRTERHHGLGGLRRRICRRLPQKDVHSSRAFDQSMTVASSYLNLFIEAEASKIVAAAAPVLTRDDAPKITRDLGIVSIISYLLEQQPDWQLDARSFKTSVGTISQWTGVSKPKECSLINIDAIRDKLQAAGNIFASVQMGYGEDVALPPAARSARGNTELCSNSKLRVQRRFYAPRTVREHDVNRPSRGSCSKSN